MQLESLSTFVPVTDTRTMSADIRTNGQMQTDTLARTNGQMSAKDTDNVHGQITMWTLAEMSATDTDNVRRTYDALAKNVRRKFPNRTWGKDTILSDEVLAALSVRRRPSLPATAPIPEPAKPTPPATPPTPPTPPPPTPPTPPATPPTPPAPTHTPAAPKKRWLLALLMLAPTAASVENMYHVTRALSESTHTAACLTVVLSASALGFIWAGVRGWYSILLAVLLIVFESFCNLTRIYGGLMGVGTTGNPTRFLGLVTDIFDTGSHYTGIFLGALTALFIAAVQYAAIFELNGNNAHK